MAAVFDGLKIVVCGASEAACVAAGMLAHQGHHVWVLASSHSTDAGAVALNGGITISRCQRSTNASTGITIHHELRQRGEVVCVTSRAADVIPAADLVIITSSDTADLDAEALAHELAPFLHRRQMLLALAAGPIARVQRSFRAAIATAATCGARPQASGTAPPSIVATDLLPWAFSMLDATTVRITAARPLVLFTPSVEAGSQRAAQLPCLLEQLFPGTVFALKTSSSPTASANCSCQEPQLVTDAAAEKDAGATSIIAAGPPPAGTSSDNGSSSLVSSGSSSNSLVSSSSYPVSPFLACQQQQQQQQISAAATKPALIKGPPAGGRLVGKLSAGRASSDVAAVSSTVTKHVQFAITA